MYKIGKMNAEIVELIQTLDAQMQDVKDTRSRLKDLIESTEIYKTVYDTTVSNGFDVSDKDAAKHSYSVTLKNYKKMMKQDD
jgi:chaperonin cofactor prefoldin